MAGLAAPDDVERERVRPCDGAIGACDCDTDGPRVRVHECAFADDRGFREPRDAAETCIGDHAKGLRARQERQDRNPKFVASGGLKIDNGECLPDQRGLRVGFFRRFGSMMPALSRA